MSNNDKVTATAEPTTGNTVETGFKAYVTYANDIGTKGVDLDVARDTLTESFVRTVVETRAYQTEKRRLLKACKQADLGSVYKTAVSARNSILGRAAGVADRLGVRQDFDDLGYASESQNPALKAERQAKRKDAAKAAAATRIAFDPSDSAGCLDRALALLERARDLDPSEGDDARLKAFAPAVKAIRAKRAKAAAKA